MAKGLVVVYYSELGGRLRTHQKIMLEVDAKAIAKLKGFEFGGGHDATRKRSGPIFFVPDDTLLVHEASSVGIRGWNDLYGGVVPHPFVKTKAITHKLVDSNADRPEGWSDSFAEKVHDVVLPGYTVFSAMDAHVATQRMLTRGAVRVKKPLGASGEGQTTVTAIDELDKLSGVAPSRWNSHIWIGAGSGLATGQDTERRSHCNR
jgi:hypothetical protein